MGGHGGIIMKYYNYDYKTKEYYEVPAPEHDHYVYNDEAGAWYEIILEENLPL